MSDFVNNVSIYEAKNKGTQICFAMDFSNDCSIKYNVETNKYEYSFKNGTIELYSTSEILDYYFGENLNKKNVKKKINTISLECGIDCITYEGVVIGFGASRDEAESEFAKAFNSITVEDVIKESESVLGTGIITGGITVSTLADKIDCPTATTALTVWYFIYHYEKATDGYKGTNLTDPSEMAKAAASLMGLDSIQYALAGSPILSKYIEALMDGSDVDFMGHFLTNMDCFSMAKFSSANTFTGWQLGFDVNSFDIPWGEPNEELDIPFDLVRFFENNNNVFDMRAYINNDDNNLWDNLSQNVKEFFSTIFGTIKSQKISVGVTLSNVQLVKSQVYSARSISYDPLILDLDGDGFNIEKKGDGANFDLDKNGFAEKINWTSRDGFLCLDLNENGIIDNGGELFGDQTLLADGKTAKNGFEALKQYDSNGDGVIDENDEIFSQLMVWVDADGNGISDEGEMKTLKELGIASINLDYENVNAETGTEATIGNTATFTREDGTTASVGELWVASDLYDTVETVNVEISEEIAKLPDFRSLGNVYSLHTAMALDETGELKGLVESFVAEEDINKRIEIAEQILFFISGAKDIAADSRGGYIDARQLVVIEAMLGEKYIGTNGANPNPNAAPILKKAYQDLLNMYFNELNVQAYLKDYVPLFRYTENEDGTKTLNADLFNLVLDYQIKNHDENAKKILAEASRYVQYLDNSGIKGTEQFVKYYMMTPLEYATEVIRTIPNGYVSDGENPLNGTNSADILAGSNNDDEIYGNNGNDILIGGKGNDHLEGGVGNDTYIFNKGDGEDTIVERMNYGFESPADKILFGEGITVDDVVFSRNGNDLILTYGEGDVITVKDNYVHTNNNVEFVEFADGTVLNAAEIADKARIIKGTAEDDELEGCGGTGGGRDDEIFYAGDGNDIIHGNDGNDTIYGDEGDDSIYGGSGNDVIVGGTGNDYMEGGIGNDTYIFNKGDGEDTIVESTRYGYESPEDRIIFGEGITVDDVVISRTGNDLILTYGEGDVVTVKDNYVHTNNNIEFIEFADGTVLNAAEIADKARVVRGTSGDDILTGREAIGGGRNDDIFYAGDGNDKVYGYDGNDIIVGGKGNDYLEGGVGNDTYIFNKGDGEDTIVERMNYGFESPADKILFGEGITVDDVIISRVGNDLILTYGEGDVITVKDNYVHTNNNVEFIEFADGTVLNAAEIADKARVVRGTSSDDVLTGRTASGGGHNDDIFYAGDGNDTVYGYDGNDIIVGGKGNDYLEGGVGNDTYIFNKGDGEDTIVERMNYGFESPADKILFGKGITVDDVVFSRIDNDLILTYGEGDVITVKDNYVHTNNNVEFVEFADGTVLNAAEIADKARIIKGTAGDDELEGLERTGGGRDDEIFYAGDGNDIIHGNDGNDTIYGDEGDDTIYGGSGNDVIVGGTGNDYMEGGTGNDTYIFNKGDGEDTIVESTRYGYESPEDRIIFGEGITVDDVVISRIDNDLILTYGEGDVVTVKDNYVHTNNNIEFVEFADGTVLNAAEIADKARVVRGTSDDDILTGRTANGGGRNDDIFYAGDGNDKVYGYDGNDIIVGGKGNDYLEGGVGNDIYIFNKGDGEDTIVERMNYGFESPADKILFGEGITVDDVIISRIDNDLILTYGEGDVVTVKDNYVHTNNNVEYVEFADGTVLNAAEIADKARVVRGTSGDDVLTGRTASGGGHNDDIFYAGDGNDTVYGYDGNDIIVGGKGNDYLEGGTGNDTYIFNKGDGEDTIVERMNYGFESPADKILFGEGITVDDVVFSRNGNDLILTYGEGDVVTVKDNYVHTNNNVEFVEFADGTVLNAAEIADKARIIKGTAGDDELEGFGGTGGGRDDEIFYAGDGNDIIHGNDGNDTIYGDNGDDTIYGGSGNDVIVGGTGNDYMEGGIGNDTYIFNMGDGEDTIVESTRYGYESPEDRIIFGEGITVDDVVISRIDNDLILTYGEGDVVTVKDNYVHTNNNIEFIEFADGTVLNAAEIADKARVVRGTSGDDVLTGRTASGGGRNDDIFYAGDGNDKVYGYDGNDTIVGGKGNDYLEGGTGNDTYIFNKGDGEDTIVERMNYGFESPADKILFGGGITVDDVVFSRIDNDLILTYGEGDVVTVKDNYVHTNNNIEFIEFADGTVLNAAEIADKARVVRGTSGDDVLTGRTASGGGHNNDIFYAGDGNDTVYGYDGNDIIVGGKGNDHLEGGVGNDTYIFNKGDGEDTIVERMNYGFESPADKILFGEGITVDDVVFSRNGNDLVISYSSEGDTVTVQDHYVHSNCSVESFETADGYSISNTQVDLLIQSMAEFEADTGMSWAEAAEQPKEQYSDIISQMWVKTA